MDILVYLLDEDAPWPHKYDGLIKDPEVSSWRQLLKRAKNFVMAIWEFKTVFDNKIILTESAGVGFTLTWHMVVICLLFPTNCAILAIIYNRSATAINQKGVHIV